MKHNKAKVIESAPTLSGSLNISDDREAYIREAVFKVLTKNHSHTADVRANLIAGIVNEVKFKNTTELAYACFMSGSLIQKAQIEFEKLREATRPVYHA